MAHFVLVNQSLGAFYRQTAEALADRGHHVTVLAGEGDRFAYRGVRFVGGPVYVRRTRTARARSWAMFLRFVYQTLPRCARGAVVLSSSNPPLLPHVCVLRTAGSRHVARVLDVYPDVLAGDRHTSWWPVQRAWRAVNRHFYDQCTTVVTLGPVMGKTLAASLGGQAAVIIPDWYTLDPTRVPPRSENPMRSELDLDDRLVVLYSGNLGIAHDLRVMVETAASLDGDDRVRFVVIGNGPQNERLRGEVARRGVGRMFRFLPFQPSDHLPVSMGLADLSVVTVAPGAGRALMPCKTYDCLAAGSALIALVEEPSDLAAIVREYECGEVVPPGRADLFESVVRRALAEPGRLTAMRVAARRAAAEYGPERQRTALVALLEKTEGSVFEGSISSA